MFRHSISGWCLVHKLWTVPSLKAQLHPTIWVSWVVPSPLSCQRCPGPAPSWSVQVERMLRVSEHRSQCSTTDRRFFNDRSLGGGGFYAWRSTAGTCQLELLLRVPGAAPVVPCWCFKKDPRIRGTAAQQCGSIVGIPLRSACFTKDFTTKPDSTSFRKGRPPELPRGLGW